MRNTLVILSLALVLACDGERAIHYPDNPIPGCEGLNDDKLTVGLTDYRECVGNKANETVPADPDLCDLSGGRIRNEMCELAE